MSNKLVNWKVSEEHSFSDHCYLQFRLDLKYSNNPTFRNRRRTNWDTFRTILGDSLTELVPETPKSTQELDALVDRVSNAFNEAILGSCPISRPKGKSRPPWWSKDLQATRLKCKNLFKIAKRTKADVDWDSYKVVLKSYKYELRSAKSKAWRLFCDNIQESSEAARLRKILSTCPVIPSYLQRPDGIWTTTGAESLELLLETHFPGCSESSTVMPKTNRATGLAGKIVNRRNILLSVNSFKPFKSAGPDGIIPADIQHASDLMVPWLEVIFKSSLELCHIPNKWTEVKVIFIPKAGKRSHCDPKDLRPISLSSYLLKTLERQIEAYIRGSIEPAKLAASQHAYCKGKSVETALHSLVGPIEKSLDYKEFSLVTFCDIEGAFNNVKPEAITQALSDLGVDVSLGCWIDQMLRGRVILASLGESSARRFVSRGTPQGGVLSPLLWNLVINDLLLNLEGAGFKVVAYADDVAIGAFGKYPSTLRDLMQNALGILTKWTNRCGLSVNPLKTELVLFSRKYKLPVFNPPTLNGVGLYTTDKVKFLGLILDSKLSWKPNILERVKKATLALYSCKNAIGKGWGLNPRIVYWLYTAVVRPVLLYGVAVWWPALNTAANQKLLMKVQRTACLCISGALRTTSTQALEILLHLIPLDILAKQMAACTAIRLKSISLWTCSNKGHSSILVNKEIPKAIDYAISTSCLEVNIRTVIPSREDWVSKAVMNPGTTNFFTDGSRIDGRVGCGVFCKELNLNLSFRLPDHCSVFQAELIAIKEAIDWMKYNVISVRDIGIFTDSQAAIKVLQSGYITSKVAQNCLSSLNEMAEQFNIQLTWVPGHFNITGNIKADELARQGTSCHILPRNAGIEVPLAMCKLLLKEEAYKISNRRWSNCASCVITRQIWPTLDLIRSEQLISMQRRNISIIVGVITGHCLIGKHASRLGVLSHDFCRSCRDEEEEETILHLLCTCPSLARERLKFFGARLLVDLSDLSEMSVRDIYCFVRSSNWFQKV